MEFRYKLRPQRKQVGVVDLYFLSLQDEPLPDLPRRVEDGKLYSQADWIEQFYTLCYSKPYIQAISWWDLVDGGSFWPHGGLLRKDMTPKQGLIRLKSLLEQWRIGQISYPKLEKDHKIG